MDAQSLQCKVLKIISAVVNITSSTLVSNHSEKKKTMIKRQLREKHFLQRKTRVMMTTGNLFQRFQANKYPFEVVFVASTKI